jgi:hypothetical protein
MDIRSLMLKMDQLSEAEDPASVIAKYQEMGKKPTADMPAFIDPKDGKVKYMDNANASMGQSPEIKVMPSDWIKRYAPDLAAALAAQGGDKAAYGAQEKGGLFGIKGLGNFDKGTKVNTTQAGADATSAAVIADLVKQATPLLDKLEQKYSSVKKESFNYTSGIARALAESVGYELTDAVSPEVTKAQAASNSTSPEIEDPDLKALANIMNQLSDIENDPKVKPLQDRYAALLNAVDTAKKAASQSATPTPGTGSKDPGTIDPNKLKRFKELLAKAKDKAKSGAVAGGAAAGGAAGAALGAANPLKNDPISANALPRKDGPVAKESLSESEIIARLRQQLENIENRGADDEQVDEFIGSAIRGLGALGKGAMSMGKNFMGGLKGAATTGGRTATGQFAKAGKGAKMANTAGKAISKNPVKTSLATGVAGAGLGYALGGKPGDPSTTVVDTDPKPNQSATPTPRPNAGAGAAAGGAADADAASNTGLIGALDQAESDELLALEKELGVHMGRLPELDNALLDYEALTKQ